MESKGLFKKKRTKVDGAWYYIDYQRRALEIATIKMEPHCRESKSSLYVEMCGILQGMLSERSQMQNNVDAVLNNYMTEGDPCLWMHVP